MDLPVRILAVDNEPSITFSLRHIFAAPRYDLTGVESGDLALHKLASATEHFDVIIIDQKMPHLTGVQLVMEIRKHRFNGNILVLSAHLSTEVREAYLQMNVHTMFEKPFDIGALRSAVDRLAA